MQQGPPYYWTHIGYPHRRDYPLHLHRPKSWRCMRNRRWLGTPHSLCGYVHTYVARHPCPYSSNTPCHALYTNGYITPTSFVLDAGIRYGTMNQLTILHRIYWICWFWWGSHSRRVGHPRGQDPQFHYWLWTRFSSHARPRQNVRVVNCVKRLFTL
jgi:hypothetical protein